VSDLLPTDRGAYRKAIGAALVVLIGVPLLLAGCRGAGMVPDPPDAVHLRIATWNLEHLNDTDDAGCVPRDEADYDAIADRIREIAPDVVAFQEVENAAAALRVFPESHWHVEVSSRPEPAGDARQCWSRPGQYLEHQATGFAIRKRIAYQRNPDLYSLGDLSPTLRWGTDITVTFGGRQLRLLSVHLKSGCWSAEQDSDPNRTNTCATLSEQILELREWADDREDEGIAFGILGDFNRRFAVSDDRAWSELSPESSPLELLTADLETQCDDRYEEFIDHIVLDADAAALLVPESTREWLRHDEHPDHCAVSADLATRP
jgi:endonuclease/exonuclease/phosphatase family metal-dependent hydrolase